jgi:hypothetical protein
MTKGAIITLGVAAYALFMPTSAGPSSDRVKRLAEAIARAEGWYATGATQNRGQRANNPGNIMTPEWTLVQYPTAAAGWDALYRQVELALSGQSRHYRPDMTIWQMAEIYVGHAGWENWARNVSSALGVPSSTPIGQV